MERDNRSPNATTGWALAYSPGTRLQTNGANQPVVAIPADGTLNMLTKEGRTDASVVGEHLEWLRRRGKARMTGSGGCVFAAFDSREGAERVLAQLPPGMRGFLARGIGHHPLHAR